MTREMLLEAVSKHHDLILEAERWLWKHPQTGYFEWEASGYMAEAFENLGYQLTRAGNIPGFYADLETGRPGPKVVVFGELDSLICADHPEADPQTHAVHACGHHAQCAALLGLAAALKDLSLEGEWSGSVRLCVVPAEELIEIEKREKMREDGVIRFFGGKTEFMSRGYLDGCDIAMMVHTIPGNDVLLYAGGNGCVAKKITYLGRAVHASAPYEGINALYAAQLGMQAINALRETFQDQDHIRVHPIITKGGTAVNAIPSEVRMESYVRGATLKAILKENKKVNRALAACAAAMGAQAVLQDRPGYAPLHNDEELLALAQEVVGGAVAGEDRLLQGGWEMGCTDLGDVSQVMPSIQIMCGGAEGTVHGNDFSICDPVRACERSAQLQLLMLDGLLKQDAERAKKTVEGFPAEKKNIKAYLETIDEIFKDQKTVHVQEDGGILLTP